MKITIEKIGQYSVEVVKYLSDDIFEFKLDTQNRFAEAFNSFKEKALKNGNSEADALDKEMIRRGLASIGTKEELVRINLLHLFSADSYYTNGQKVISVVKKEEQYEVGVHENLQRFANYFYPYTQMGGFTLETFPLESFYIKEKAEVEIVKVLSKLEIIRIPTVHDAEFDYIEVQSVHPLTYKFKFDGKEVAMTLGGALDLDEVSVRIIKEIRPKVLKCCRNCTHFQYSGMSHSMSDGAIGYCKIFREKLIEDSVEQSITHIWNWCENFKANERF